MILLIFTELEKMFNLFKTWVEFWKLTRNTSIKMVDKRRYTADTLFSINKLLCSVTEKDLKNQANTMTKKGEWRILWIRAVTSFFIVYHSSSHSLFSIMLLAAWLVCKTRSKSKSNLSISLLHLQGILKASKTSF